MVWRGFLQVGVLVVTVGKGCPMSQIMCSLGRANDLVKNFKGNTIEWFKITLHNFTNSFIFTHSFYTVIRCKPHNGGSCINRVMVMWLYCLSWGHNMKENGPGHSWLLHRPFTHSPKHGYCSVLYFCEVEVNLFYCGTLSLYVSLSAWPEGECLLQEFKTWNNRTWV